MLEYIPRTSPVHRLHPLTKLIWAFAILILTLVFNNPWYLLGVVLSVVVVAFIGKVGRETLGYLAALLVISGVVFVLQVIFRPEGRVLFTMFPESWPVVGGRLPVTSGGIRYGFAVSLRMLGLMSTMPVLLTTTQPRDIVMALVDTLHVPYDYAFMFTTALRFMPVILSEVSTISQAQRSRAYAVEGWNPLKKLQALGPIALPIVFIAIEKADRLGLCMELRGYGNKNRTYLRSLRLEALDFVALGLVAVGTTASLVAAALGYGHVALIGS
jgi:energy-coupling factor transport system permease protein